MLLAGIRQPITVTEALAGALLGAGVLFLVAEVYLRVRKIEGLGMGDVIQMTVFLVGVPENNGRMDFPGFMEAYTQYFGTKQQPNLPARSAVQVADLAAPGMLVEIEVVLARP